MMTLPRLLTWEEGALRVRPWDAVESLRRDHIRLEHIAVLANQETILDGITGDALEISMEIDLGKTKTFELSVAPRTDRNTPGFFSNVTWENRPGNTKTTRPPVPSQ